MRGKHLLDVGSAGNGVLGDQGLEPVRLCESAARKGAITKLKSGKQCLTHIKKYSCVIGSVSAGGTVASSPSSRTS